MLILPSSVPLKPTNNFPISALFSALRCLPAGIQLRALEPLQQHARPKSANLSLPALVLSQSWHLSRWGQVSNRQMLPRAQRGPDQARGRPVQHPHDVHVGAGWDQPQSHTAPALVATGACSQTLQKWLCECSPGIKFRVPLLSIPASSGGEPMPTAKLLAYLCVQRQCQSHTTPC